METKLILIGLLFVFIYLNYRSGKKIAKLSLKIKEKETIINSYKEGSELLTKRNKEIIDKYVKADTISDVNSIGDRLLGDKKSP